MPTTSSATTGLAETEPARAARAHDERRRQREQREQEIRLEVAEREERQASVRAAALVEAVPEASHERRESNDRRHVSEERDAGDEGGRQHTDCHRPRGPEQPTGDRHVADVARPFDARREKREPKECGCEPARKRRVGFSRAE